jgi:K+-sensing histidine kinase KdpD
MKASLVRILLAGVSPIAATILLLPLRDHVENTNLALALVVAILFAAVVGGRIGGCASAVGSAFAFDFFLTRPFISLRISAADDVQTTLLLAVIGLIAGELVERARRSGARAEATAVELASAYQRAEFAAGTEEPGRLIGLAVDELTRMLGLKSCRFVPGPLPTAMPVLTHQAVRVPANVAPSARGLIGLAVRAHGRLQGHLVMAFPTRTVGTSLTSDQRHAAVAIADQLGVGLLRFHEP